MKPKCKLIGECGNIFNLMAVASQTLREHGMKEKVYEMQERIFTAPTYDVALSIIDDYVEIEEKEG